MKVVTILTLLVMSVLPGLHAADYGAKIVYRKGTPLTFPDFALTFVGERRGAMTPRYPRGFLYFDFLLAGKSGPQTVSWSSGTGDIGPVLFKYSGQPFTIELQFADKLGRLEDHELVIRRGP